MSVTNSGKGLYWLKNEILDIKLTEMATESEYQGKKERNIGKKKFTHFVEEDGKNRAVPCEGGKLNCPLCRANNKATMKFTTILTHNDVNYYSDLPVTLSRALADAQMILRDTGMDDNAVLAVTFTVSRLAGAPYWDVRIKKGTQQKTIPQVSINVEPTANNIKKGIGAATVPMPTPSELDALDVPEETSTPLASADLDTLRKYESTIVKNLSKKPDWDMHGALSTALKNLGWTGDKIQTAFKFFDDKGNFVLRSDLVIAE